jgi:para-aminobenzoate synthetase/4-amino-4-deoxychorismate lyase
MAYNEPMSKTIDILSEGSLLGLGRKDESFAGDVDFVSRHATICYRSPSAIVKATCIEEVMPALAEIEAAVERGLHAAGFIAYEAAPAFDPAFRVHDAGDAPLLWFGLYAQRVESTVSAQTPVPGAFDLGKWQAEVAEAEYTEALRRIRERVGAGDTYQVNYTYPSRATFNGSARAWFEHLCRGQSADYRVYMDTGNTQIVSLSPELFFRLEGDTLTAKPMKGTHARGLWSGQDVEAARALRNSPKERAENIMIVDLLRNDLGRISEIGSVEVERLFETERYETLWQMTSTIKSKTRAPISEIFGALFPSGSVTGAPKINTMKIIRELERFPRGVYCGCIGWISPGRQAEFNVAIRTATVDPQAGVVHAHVGSGVTWGSDPESEYEECQVKMAYLDPVHVDFQLLESIRWEGEFFLLEEHLERLRNSATYFAIQIDDDALRQTLDESVGELGEGIFKIRLLVRRDGVAMVESEPAKAPRHVRARLAPEAIDAQDPFLYHKTTHRAVYERAAATKSDCDDTILWNAEGEVTESTIANLAALINGEWVTPPIRCGLLPGTMRRHLLEQGKIVEGVITKKALGQAEEIALFNSVRKWVEVELVD